MACWETLPGTQWPHSTWTHPLATHSYRVCQSSPGYHLQDLGIGKLQFQNRIVPLLRGTLAGAREGPEVRQRLEQEWKSDSKEKASFCNGKGKP